MKTLKDVCIKVTEKNKDDIKEIIGFRPYYEYVCFDWDGLDGAITTNDPYLKQKVSLSELKRLIETIPTREEITRLKRQISAYKTNYDKVVKHSLSKEDVIEELTIQNDKLKSSFSELEKDLSFAIGEHNAEIKINAELSLKNSSLQNLYDDALEEIEELKKQLNHVVNKNETQGVLIEEKNFKISDLERIKEDFADVIMYRNKEIAKLSKELERLKNKKWYQIWK